MAAVKNTSVVAAKKQTNIKKRAKNVKITEETVDRISKLCKLSFDVSEKKTLIEGLNGMIGFVKTLQYLDTSSDEITTNSNLYNCPMRDDTLGQSLSRDDILGAAPLTDGETFCVPKTVEEN